MSTEPRHPADGSATQVKPHSVDPSLQQSAEDSLQASERKYQRLVEGISGDYIIYTHDPEGLITYVSPSVEKVLGFPPDAIVGLNWRDLVGEHFVGREQADRVADEILAGKKFYNFQIEISHADGTTRFAEIQQRPLFDSAGQYISMEGIAKDITQLTRNAEELQELREELELRVVKRTAELNRINERLLESEARYRTVVDCQTEFVVRWTTGAIFTFVNEAFCRLVDRTSEDLLGWCFLPMVHADDAALFEQAIGGLSRENPTVAFESRLVMPDESIRWTHWTNQMLFDESGNFLEYQSVGRDITELKKANEIIREKEASLAHVSRLASMGELVSGIAHEIHQPLHAAKTFAEAARRNLEIGDPDNIEIAVDCTNEISAAITRTATIIRRIREFTRSRPVSFELLNLNEVVDGACAMMAYETHKAQVKLQFELAPELPLVEGDRVQLEQACVNLLMNAYEAMSELPPPDRKLLISTKINSQLVSLAFRDSGCGFAECDRGRLFDAFYSTKPQSMGMGLSLCKSIAETHGGLVLAEENEGPGATFVIELPIPSRIARRPNHE